MCIGGIPVETAHDSPSVVYHPLRLTLSFRVTRIWKVSRCNRRCPFNGSRCAPLSSYKRHTERNDSKEKLLTNA